MSNYQVGVLTSSDRCFAGKTTDLSGPKICNMLTKAGYTIKKTTLLPDHQEQLSTTLKNWCDIEKLDLIFTTGGTGFAPRDCMPEATLCVVDRLSSGIAEAIRAFSFAITPNAMFSRAISGIRKNTLIINLPGNPKAVEEILSFLLPHLSHGIDVLKVRENHEQENSEKK